MFLRKELIGETKVNVTEKSANVLRLARLIADAKTEQGDDAAFIITNLDVLCERFKLWTTELPQIQPFYAVKCNPDETILRCLAALGANFDCASRAEIDMVLKMGVAADRIIFANPCKSRAFISYAESKGVNKMTFDCVEELEKMIAFHKCPELILRFAITDLTADDPLIGKYGADPVKSAPRILHHAAKLGVNIVGVSFHLGSGCNDPSVYRTALQHARDLFDIGEQLGHEMEIVDIGGGFPGGALETSFEKIASTIRSATAEFFPDPSVRIIAEPGRFFAANPCTIVANVIATKFEQTENDTGHMHYYINDGAYGSFNNVLFNIACPPGQPLMNRNRKRYLSTIWGPTLDSGDKIETNTMWPAMDAGDWVIYEGMGAYTTSASSSFNGFEAPTPIHVISERNWKLLGMDDK